MITKQPKKQKAPRPETEPAVSVQGQNGPGRQQGLIILLAVCFLAIVVGKFMLIAQCAAPLPYNDEWDGVISHVLLPYASHTLQWGYLFAPFNEHRMLFVRLWDIAFFRLWGTYDNRVECYFNAFLHAGIVVMLGWMLLKGAGGKLRWPMALALLAITLPPFAWENTISGFQTQVYFMLLFSVLAIYFLTAGKDSKGGWALGLVFGVCSIFTLGSGFIAATVTLPFCKSWKRALPLIAITLLGAWLKFGFDAGYTGGAERGYAAQRAQNLVQLCVALGKNTSWPCMLMPWVFPVMLAPVLLLAWKYLAGARAGSNDGQTDFVLAMGLWSMAQFVAAALLRANAVDGMPVSRYGDTYALSVPTSLAALWLLHVRHGMNLQWLMGAWATLVIVGVVTLTQYMVPLLKSRLTLNQMWDRNTRYLVSTGDVDSFNGQPHYILPAIDTVTPAAFYSMLTNAIAIKIIKLEP